MKSVFVSVLLLHYCTAGQIWKDCSAPGDHVKINSVFITPNPPAKGDAVSVMADITIQNNTVITAGSINVTVKLDTVPLLVKAWKLCAEADLVHVQCPIKSGQLKLSAKPTIPALAPPGNYSVNAVITDQDKNQLLCIEADFKL